MRVKSEGKEGERQGRDEGTEEGNTTPVASRNLKASLNFPKVNEANQGNKIKD